METASVENKIWNRDRREHVTVQPSRPAVPRRGITADGRDHFSRFVSNSRFFSVGFAAASAGAGEAPLGAAQVRAYGDRAHSCCRKGFLYFRTMPCRPMPLLVHFWHLGSLLARFVTRRLERKHDRSSNDNKRNVNGEEDTWGKRRRTHSSM